MAEKDIFGPEMPKQNLPNTSKHYDNVTWRRYVTFEKCFSTETLFTEFGSHKLWSALRKLPFQHINKNEIFDFLA